MSLSLVKKSLSLVDETLKTNSENNSTNERIGRKQVKKSSCGNIKKKKLLSEDSREKAISVVQRIKKRLENEKKVNRIEENIKNLKALSEASRINQKLEKKIVDNIRDRKKRVGSNVENIKDSDNKQSVFTEEDFVKFEKEYFHS